MITSCCFYIKIKKVILKCLGLFALKKLYKTGIFKTCYLPKAEKIPFFIHFTLLNKRRRLSFSIYTHITFLLFLRQK